MAGMKIRKGDTVIVLQGKDRGKEGEVLEVMPKRGKILVQGVNVAKRSTKPRSATQQGGIIDKTMPIDASNVALVEKGKAVRAGYRINNDGTKTRISRGSKASGGEL